MALVIEVGKLYRTKKVCICVPTRSDDTTPVDAQSRYIGSRKLVLLAAMTWDPEVVHILYENKLWRYPRKNLRVAYKQQ